MASHKSESRQGGRLGAGLMSLELDRQEALDGFLADWQNQTGPVDEAAVEAMAVRYGL